MGNFASIQLTANGEVATAEQATAGRDPSQTGKQWTNATVRDVTAENAALERASAEIAGRAGPIADERTLNDYEARRARYEDELTRLQHLEAAGRPVPQSAREHLQREYTDLYITAVRLGLIKYEG